MNEVKIWFLCNFSKTFDFWKIYIVGWKKTHLLINYLKICTFIFYITRIHLKIVFLNSTKLIDYVPLLYHLFGYLFQRTLKFVFRLNLICILVSLCCPFFKFGPCISFEQKFYKLMPRVTECTEKTKTNCCLWKLIFLAHVFN